MPWCCFTFFSSKAFFGSILVIFALDALVSFGLFVTGAESPEERKQDKFHGSAIDVLVCCAIRLIAIPFFVVLALRVFRRTAAASPLRRLQQQEEEESASPSRAAVNGGSGNDLSRPLQTINSSSSFASNGTAATSMSLFDAQQAHALLMKKANKRKAIIMAALFAIVTALSMYNGLKCVSFHFATGSQTMQGMLFGAILFLSNLEYFLVKDWLAKLTEEKGELLPNLHMHELFFELGLKCHQCDICHESMKGPHYIAYRCRTCDFDLCPRCHRKRNDPNAKGYGARAVRRDGEQLSTWSYFKRIVQMTLEFGCISTAAVVCLVGTQAMQIWAPNITGKIFDGIITFMGNPDGGRSQFEYAMVLYLCVNIAQGAFSGLKALFQDLVLRQLACSVRMKLFQSVIRMDIAFFDTMHTGQLTSRLTNDASQMVQPLNTLMNDLIANLMLLVGGCVMAFHTSWKLSMLALTVVPPITFMYRRYAQWGRKINRSIYCAYGEANSVATEAIHNIRTVRGFSTEALETRKYEDIMGTALSHARRNAYVGASVSAFSTYLNLGTAVLILWYGGTQVCDSRGQTMSLGSLITYQLYWNMMNSAFIQLGNVFNDLIRSSSAAERVISLIDARPEVDPDEGAIVTRGSIQGHLRLEGVQFRYKTRPENLVLKGIDMDVKPGTTTALVGKSGGGKSTLVHLLMRFYEPTDGFLSLDGKDMRQLSSRSVRACCGFVAQDTQLFAKSIGENLAYGLDWEPTSEEIIAACKAANAHEFIMETEEGYETRVGERGMMLSGGQRQRLAIARCFLRKPVLLFLDEATSALDAENEAVVQEALDTLIQTTQCTVVLIAHRLSTVINATQIAVVHKGEIIERGPHDTLLKLGGIYAKLVERQMSRDASAVVDAKKAEGGGKGKKMQTEIDQLIEEMEGSGALSGAGASPASDAH
mmetsp:Transcript_34234/g.72928  ORF Transcript_34234/g.72928 Transcript_34234/m.72928 type:complete len:934 (+) Transcript_34234:121-2922(+)